MASTLTKVYGRFEEAEQVREQLLAAGFPASQVHLSSNDDEAGAVQGNFYTGNTDSQHDRSGAWFDTSGAAEDHNYQRDFTPVIKRGNYLLVIDAEDEEQASRASHILAEAGDSGEGEQLNGRHH